MRRLAAFREHLKERLEDTRSTEPPEPLPYAVPFAKFFGQRSPGNAVDRKIVDCLQEFTVVTPRLSPARLHRVEHVKCDPPIPLRHSRQQVRLPDAGHAVIRLISDSGIRQKCMPGIPSTQPNPDISHWGTVWWKWRPRSGRRGAGAVMRGGDQVLVELTQCRRIGGVVR